MGRLKVSPTIIQRRNQIMKKSIIAAEDVVKFMKQEKKEKQDTYMHFRMSESMVKIPLSPISKR